MRRAEVIFMPRGLRGGAWLCRQGLRMRSDLQLLVWEGLCDGRGREIRTPDPLVPNQVRYQTALCPDSVVYTQSFCV